jgi:RNA polymerase sigma-70 factor (ECF subfamily)
METSIRLFHMNDADKPQRGAQSRQEGSTGAGAPDVSNSAAAQAAGEQNAGEAAMARSELLEVADPCLEEAAAQATGEREKAGPRRSVDVLPDAARVEGEVNEEDGGDEEDGDEVGVAAPAEAGDDLIDLSGFEAMFERFQTPIINFVYRLVGNREQAYDLAQDVFVKAYKALAGGTRIHSGALSAWLYRIAANTATDALRRKRLIAWLPLSLFQEDRGVGAGNGGGDGGGREEGFPGSVSLYNGGGNQGGRFEQRVADREMVEKVLSKLPEKYSVCLLLYEQQGFSCNEIADVLKISPSAVKMRLMRARERFISLYQEEEAGP